MLHEDGFVIVPKVIDDDQVERLRHAIEEGFSKANNGESSRHAMRHLARAVPEVRALAESVQIRALIEPVIGRDARLVRSLFFDKTAETNWNVAWHQDLTITVERKIDVPGFSAWSVKDGSIHVQPPASVLEGMLTVRVHLDDCDLDNGPLQVFPGTHKTGRLSSQDISDLQRRVKPIPCLVPSGGAVVMRPLLLHASSKARTPRHRRVVHLEFAAERLPGGLEWEEMCVVKRET